MDAYRARRALDYLVGFQLSPVLWRKLPGARSAGGSRGCGMGGLRAAGTAGAGFGAVGQVLLAGGNVQGPC